HRTNRGTIRSSAERLSIAHTGDMLGHASSWVADNMTALVWVSYLIFLEGLLTLRNGASPVRRRPNHFLLLCLASVFIWGVFDMINFNLGMRAWIYIGMPGTPGIPGDFYDRAFGYLLAFATVVPGMMLSGQVLLDLKLFDWARSTGRDGFRMPHWGLWASLIGGATMLACVILIATPVTNYVLWTSLVFLLDPINYWLGRPSMFRDWERGWYGRTLAAFAGGLICGFLWEFWNYWALTKWTYHLPFLGGAEQYRYFEMPLPGLLGFIPFGIECWIMWQMIRIPLDGLAEPLPGDRDLI
ncbi:MAG: hypothetical protein JWN40_4425, partial [Phycisphaerales bacterium]|nr:hypothetical protein [Phycisphaerales bacterium]